MPISPPTSGLKLWLKADAGVTTSSGLVTNWADQSGNGNNVAQATSSLRPAFNASSINGLPGITFSNTVNPKMMLVNTTSVVVPLTSPRHVIAVVKPAINNPGGLLSMRNSAHAGTIMLGGGLGSGLGFKFVTSDGFAEAHVITDANPAGVSGVPTVAEYSFTGWAGTFTVKTNTIARTTDGSTVSNNETAAGGPGFTVGTDVVSGGNLVGGSGGWTFNGDICEILVYDHVLSSGDLTVTREYLQLKYNINLGITNLSISPTSVSLNGGGSQTFTGANGSGTYTYSIAVNNSGGTINASTGAYTAGSLFNSVIDTVRVTDGAGATADATVNVAAHSLDLSKLRIGDYAYIYGSEFAPANTNGTFKITDVNVTYSGSVLNQYFEIENPSGLAASGIVQTSLLDLNFYRPRKSTIYDNQHVSVINKSGALNIDIPATTQVVARQPGIAAYINVNTPIQISSLIRDASGTVTVNTAINHGLVTGNQIIVEGVFPSGSASSVTNGSPSGAFSGNVASGTTNASIQSSISSCTTVAAYNHQIVKLPAGQLMVVGGQTQTDNTHVTALTNPIILELTGSSTLSNGGRQDSYTWKNLNTLTYSIANRAFGYSVLPDGTVLLSGGTTGDDITGTANNHWDLISYSDTSQGISSGTLPISVATHAQCARSNGDALIAGGWTTAGVPLNSTYTFGGGTHIWTAKANLNIPRMYAKMMELPTNSNLVLIAGGQTTGSIPTNTTEIFNTTGNTWTKVGPMTYARYSFGMISLPDGRILVAGGVGYNPTRGPLISAPLKSCEVFDPSTNLWSCIGDMSVARTNPSLIYLPNKNQIWIIGAESNKVDILDLRTFKLRQSIVTIPNNYAGSVSGSFGTDTIAIIGGLNGVATIAADYLIVPGSESQRSGGLNGIFTITSVPAANQLIFKTSNYSKYSRFVSATTGTITPAGAQPAPKGIPGPFSYDTKNGLSVSPSISAVLNQQINKDNFYNSIELNTSLTAEPAFNFPNEEGYIVINYGFANQVGPIKYLGWFDETSIRIDPGFKFPANIDSGASIYWLTSRAPFEPPSDKLIGNFYVTNSAAGRIAAIDNINKITAGGTDMKINILYPKDIGLGGAGFPTTGPTKLSDIIEVFGGDDIYKALLDAQNS